ncbi:hypothetical protein HDV05_003972, partial [Chytridiales sp. JEL 0842]
MLLSNIHLLLISTLAWAPSGSSAIKIGGISLNGEGPGALNVTAACNNPAFQQCAMQFAMAVKAACGGGGGGGAGKNKTKSGGRPKTTGATGTVQLPMTTGSTGTVQLPMTTGATGTVPLPMTTGAGGVPPKGQAKKQATASSSSMVMTTPLPAPTAAGPLYARHEDEDEECEEEGNSNGANSTTKAGGPKGKNKGGGGDGKKALCGCQQLPSFEAQCLPLCTGPQAADVRTLFATVQSKCQAIMTSASATAPGGQPNVPTATGVAPGTGGSGGAVIISKGLNLEASRALLESVVGLLVV